MGIKPVLPQLLSLFAMVILFGMQIDVMEVDAAQYASIAREMLHGGDFLQIFEHGKTYQSKGFPDKPPLVFWAGAGGMWLLGEGNVGYKIFSVLIAMGGIWAIGRWATLLFGHEAKWPARLFYGSTVGMLLMFQDVRTDTLLIGCLTISMYYLEQYFRNEKRLHFFLTFVFLALAMLAKGPIALVTLAVAFGGDALIRRDWQRLWRWEWIGGVLIVMVLLSPMLWGLYQQWGFEKGIKYYFWTQSFGRITGENPWKNDTNAFFLSETFLWSFLPWTLLFLASIVSVAQQKFKTIRGPGSWVAPIGFTAMLVAMSSSQYQLPHYIYIVWPFASLWLAAWYTQQAPSRFLRWSQLSLSIFIFAISCLLLHWSSNDGLPGDDWQLGNMFIVCVYLAMSIWETNKVDTQSRLLVHSVLAILFFGIVANGFFYPMLLRYQSSSRAGKTFQTLDEPHQAYYYETGDESLHALHFYSQTIFQPLTNPAQELHQEKAFIYTTERGMQALLATSLPISVKQTLPYFQVTHLNATFLNPKTRSSALEKRYILLYSP